MLRSVSPAGCRPGSRSGYRPRAGSARGVSAGTTAGAGRPNAGAGLLGSSCHPRKPLAGCGSVCLGLGCGSTHVLDAPGLISTQLCTNRSGCTPIIPALARWRQEDLTFNVILENLRNSGSLSDRYPISRVINMQLKSSRGGCSWGLGPPECMPSLQP